MDEPWLDPAGYWTGIDTLTADRSAPLAIAHATALRHNAEELVARARRSSAGHPTPTIRVGSKSIRCRGIIEQLLATDGFAGVFGYTLPEALFLHQQGIDDIIVGYPSTDRRALARLCADSSAASSITLMIDEAAQLDLIDSVAPPDRRPALRICLELDLALDLPGLPRIGVWRSPLRDPGQATRLASQVVRRRGFDLVGLLGYEAQLAGLGDNPPNPLRGAVIRGLQARSRAEVAERRGTAVESIRRIAELEFVNGGGSGSVESTAADPSVTEITAGSAITAPTLFDSYRWFRPAPATAFALDVVRRPSRDRATLLGGGWIASGPPGADRQPTPVWPPGLTYEPLEGAGEVQTPVRGAAALEVGDRVWLRHAKGGELAEHINHYLLLDSDRVIGELPTYRGEGGAFL